MKIKGLVIKNPRNWKEAEYKADFDEDGRNTTIPSDLLEKLGLKPGGSVMFFYKDNHVTTTVGSNGRIGLTRPEINKLGYMK